MKQFVAVLGHQPHISLAELEIRYSSAKLSPLSNVCLLDVQPEIELLGGVPKTAEVTKTFSASSNAEIFSELKSYLSSHIENAERKVNLGLSFHTPKSDFNEMRELSRSLLKELKAETKKLRMIPNRAAELNSAQVWHNKLLLDPNLEILVIKDGENVIFARTIGVQNIRGYTIRDRSKPARDAKVGMLPPKLAKSMISMADVGHGGMILDPFCGSGTVLMEALLDGYKVYGSDLSDSMVEATRANLDWLAHNMKLDYTKVGLEVADAQEFKWPITIDGVVSEIYLGPPLRHLPNKEKHIKIMSQVNKILRNTLTNLGAQLRPGTKLVLAVPAWALPKNRGYLKLKTVDELSSLGYNLLDLKLANTKELIYHRPNQVVARQLLILEKK